MSIQVEPDAREVSSDAEFLQYRSLSAGAVAGLVLGLISVIIIPAAMTSVEAALLTCPIPLAGLVVGLKSLLKVRRQRDELTGQALAAVGSLLSAAFLAGGLGLASYVYATEVPPGYERVTFAQLKPDGDEELRGMIVPGEVIDMNRKRVFIKGYMRPQAQSYHLDSFLLVRDNNECCFGESLPAYYDRIDVRFVPGLRTNYSTGVFRLAGELRIDPAAVVPGSGRAVYSLTADYLD